MHATFAKILPDLPLHYDFVDEEYAANYRSEMLTGSLTYYFAIISILISCLGLFGLATFMAKQRKKEIGIRKVLGASVENITTLISTDFLKTGSTGNFNCLSAGILFNESMAPGFCI